MVGSNEASDSPRLRTEVSDGVLTLTLDRPEVRNAIDRRESVALCAAADRLDADDGLRAAVITGAGGNFSSGTDLRALEAGDSTVVDPRGFYGFVGRPPAKPVVAAVEGYAVGGGFELALACDLIVASTTARFGLPEVRLGMFAGAGGVLRLAQRIPYHHAMELSLTGELIDASRAERLGLLNQLVPEGAALETAKALACRIAAGAPLAVRATLEVARNAPVWDEARATARQGELTHQVLRSEDAAEGAAAFMEKRPPRWRGR
jgi:enoyl-CoA hydratase